MAVTSVVIFLFLWFGPWMARGTRGLWLMSKPALVATSLLIGVGGLLVVVVSSSRKPGFRWWRSIALCLALALPAYVVAWLVVAIGMVVLEMFLIDWETTPLADWFGRPGPGGGHMPFPDLTPVYLAMVSAGPVAAPLLAPFAAAYGSVTKGVWLWPRAVSAVATAGSILVVALWLLLLTRRF